MTDDTASPGATKKTQNHGAPEAPPTMEGPATYRICVKGVLAPDWSNRLAGMQITPADEGKTVLLGRLNDQAALAGVLAALYELHLPVYSVEVCESD